MSKLTVTIAPEGKESVTHSGSLCIAAVRNPEDKSMNLLCIGDGSPMIISNMLTQLVERLPAQMSRMERMLALMEIHEKTDELLIDLFKEINNEKENGGNDNE